MNAEHSRKTLMGYSKEDLVEHCMALEHNNKALKMQFETQYQNCMKIIEDMNVLNKGFKETQHDNALQNTYYADGAG